MLFDLDSIGAGLAFASALPALREVVSAPGSAAVVQSPPGTGKTTLVPPLLATLRQRGAGRIVVTAPRRVAARSAARRLAALDGTALGGRVGYTVRGERHAGPDTIVEFVTPGILLRRLLSDPGQDDVAAVVLDEVHERGLETDLLLGMLAEVRELRGDLTLVAMSATVEAPLFAALLKDDAGNPAPIISSPSVLFPLECVWAPAQGPRMDQRGVSRTFLNHVASVAAQSHAQALASNTEADALVFAPGAWEVSYIAARLRELGARSPDRVNSPLAEVIELHGQVPASAQDRAVAGRLPGGPPRVIVSTSLAESSLTIPGVRLVVDAGLSREPRRDAGRGMSGLVTVSCSQASSIQRAGRAARQAPGTVVRCYAEKTFGAAAAHQLPEISVADLSAAALVLACWGAPGAKGLSLPSAPPQAAMAEAIEVLTELGAVDAGGQATPLGKTLARIPADPRLARALLDGAATVGPRKAAETVALVAGDYRAPGADLPRLLTSLRSGRDPSARRWVEDTARMEKIARRQMLANVADLGVAGTDDCWGFVVALAYPDRVARRVGDTRQYLLASGTRAGLPLSSTLSGSEWLAVAEVSRASGLDAAGTGAVIRSAAPLSIESACFGARHLATDTVVAQFSKGKLSARRERRLGAILLSSTPVKATKAQGRTAVAQALQVEGMGILHWSMAADGLRHRLAILHRVLGDPWPDVSDAGLLERIADWLTPELEAIAAGRLVEKVDLLEPLRRLLPWPEAVRLAELVPERLRVPSGSLIRIDYADADSTGHPVVAVKLQECFGWAETPKIVAGRVPVLFHLLSPAGRPLAVTGDLASFWSGPYAQVRAEMRGRYPKHPWPEDPWSARATAKVKSRMKPK